MSALPNIPDVPVARSAAWEQTVRIRGPIMAVLMAAMLGEADVGIMCSATPHHPAAIARFIARVILASRAI